MLLLGWLCANAIPASSGFVVVPTVPVAVSCMLSCRQVLPWGCSILGCTLAGAAVQLIASTGLREGFVFTWLVVMLYCGRGGGVYRAWGRLLAGGAVAAVAVLQ